MSAVAHWDDVEPRRIEFDPLCSNRFDLGTAAGSVTAGVARVQVDPGKHSSPVHVEGAEEEIFYVLGGSGLSWQDGEVYEVGEGDCLVHLAGEEEHTLVAGPNGLDVLAFGERSAPPLAYLPRAGVARIGVTHEVSKGPHPFEREAAAGPLELPEPSPRPSRIVNLADVEVEEEHRTTVHSDWRDLGGTAGSVRTGLNHVTVAPGRLMAAPHCHSAEEEIFVVLDGDGELELIPTPRAAQFGRKPERHPVRRGSVVARPRGSRFAHAFHAGEDGLTVLAYGTRDPNDICYYPRSNKISIRGVGVIARLEHLDYWDGED